LKNSSIGGKGGVNLRKREGDEPKEKNTPKKVTPAKGGEQMLAGKKKRK